MGVGCVGGVVAIRSCPACLLHCHQGFIKHEKEEFELGEAGEAAHPSRTGNAARGAPDHRARRAARAAECAVAGVRVVRSNRQLATRWLCLDGVKAEVAFRRGPRPRRQGADRRAGPTTADNAIGWWAQHRRRACSIGTRQCGQAEPSPRATRHGPRLPQVASVIAFGVALRSLEGQSRRRASGRSDPSGP